jgi:hypothetical protein
MGPPENFTRDPENQGAGRRKRRARRRRAAFRARRCLLKGCEQRFHPRQARQHYCSQGCRAAARRWSGWKAQQRYRSTTAGHHKRNGQSRRYRERVKSRKPPESEAVKEVPRVITTTHFFRPILRPAGVLRGIPASAAKSLTAFLFARVQTRGGARPGTGTAVAEGARFNPEILKVDAAGFTFRLSDATGVSPAGAALGAPASAPRGAATAVVGVAGRERPANTHCGGGSRRPSRSVRGHRRLQADRGAGATGP